MFSKILIANRGEIACRVIQTCKRLGISTVAVYSEPDRHALHVQMADEAVAIGPAPAADSYLVGDKIIAAVRETGAEAVHPGYGFLSENAAFAAALGNAGFTFIGPNIRAIEVMGDKIESKKFADAAGVSTVPGHLGVIADTGQAEKIAGEIGYPVMIKASAGGGGKGMRVARSREEVADGFASSVSEAKSSFGDDRVFIEKFIENPRHIEIQVLADKHGNTIHLCERECSIQRRNQKVVEEAPSSFLNARTRKAMGGQAVALAAAVNYESAGTVEFIVDAAQNFYFLEMNTRLQVEHPVTELITGVDLVEQMIRVAAGETLAIKQAQVRINGWAIESRIYAEDPYRNFLPSIGRLVRYRPPAEQTVAGITVRNDTGVYEGGEISMFYDPMIAKLCTHAGDRAAAIDAMSRALDAFYIEGIAHNIPFLSALMQHPRWRYGDISTSFIAEEYPDGFSPRSPDPDDVRLLAAVAAVIDGLGNTRRLQISGQMEGRAGGFPENRSVVFADGAGTVQHLRIASSGSGESEAFIVTFPDEPDSGENGGVGAGSRSLRIETEWWPGEPVWQGTVDGRSIAVQVEPVLNGVRLHHAGLSQTVHVYTRREAELAALMPEKSAPDTSRLLLCPMPGLVTSLAVKVGDEVRAGDTLCVIEAMKMENILRAERDATVSRINAAAGDSLAVDAVIMEFE